jgi:hypothetical protein
MPAARLTPFQPGDRITLRKPHPCGGREWEVYRIGADIGLRCLTCERRFMLARREVERRMKSRVAATPDAGGQVEVGEGLAAGGAEGPPPDGPR